MTIPPVYCPPTIPADPPRRPLDWILDHNPLYLLSAALMLLGCFLLSTALDVRAGDVTKLLLLLGTMNVYEFLLIGLGIFLWKHRGIVRDGTILLLIEGLFLADLTFLNAEASAVDVTLGAQVNGILLLLALVKFGLIAWQLPLEKSPRVLGFVALQLAMLCALPVFLRWISEAGMIGPRPFWGLWWAVGLLPVAYDLVCKLWSTTPSTAARADDRPRETIRRAWSVFPWIGLVAHLGFQHWVYRADFYATELSPVLLGLMVLVPRLPVWVRGPNVLGARLTLLTFALLFAATNPAELAFSIAGTATQLSPGLTTVGAAALLLAYSFGWTALACTAGSVAILVAVRLWGPSRQSVGTGVEKTWNTVTPIVDAIIPRTAAAWGIVAVVGAFIALGAGLLVSLTRPPRDMIKE